MTFTHPLSERPDREIAVSVDWKYGDRVNNLSDKGFYRFGIRLENVPIPKTRLLEIETSKWPGNRDNFSDTIENIRSKIVTYYRVFLVGYHRLLESICIQTILKKHLIGVYYL